MFRILLVYLLLFTSTLLSAQSNDSITIRRFYDEALTNGKAYGWLDILCNKIGPRLSGSAQAANAVQFVKQELEKIPADRVFLQDVMVPHWVRGEKEQAYVISKGKKEALTICALGGSISTPDKGMQSKIIEVHDFDELEKLGKENISGKIVFMNHPMNPKFINTFEAYGEAAKYRYSTAGKAAPLGAIGVVVRSMTLSMNDFPHTGAMGYPDSVTKIPSCAISTLGAEKLSSLLKEDPQAEFYFYQTCQTLTDAPSHNVLGEIKGSEFPDEVILIGGHLDSWDLGTGASDDGTGVVQAMEVINLMKALQLKPKRTIRCIAFMNEENGGKGGAKYAELAKINKERNIAAIESDAGGFTPRGFSFKGDSIQALKVMNWKSKFLLYNLNEWKMGYGGADINHLQDQGTLLIGFIPDSQRYFEIHHAATDTYEKVSLRELELGAASIAALVWLISEYGI
ncbi:M28 family peptidase [soil metagenome]